MGGVERLVHWSAAIMGMVVAATWLTAGIAEGQSTSADAPRKVRVAVKPDYSALAKRLNLNGLVKVEVVIGLDGRVRKAHVVGGHPVLALEAEKAALATEFESAPRESAQVMEFRFGSGN